MSPLLNVKKYTFINFALSLLLLINHHTIKGLIFSRPVSCHLPLCLQCSLINVVVKFDDDIVRGRPLYYAISIMTYECFCMYVCVYVNSTESGNRQCELSSLTKYQVLCIDVRGRRTGPPIYPTSGQKVPAMAAREI